MIRALWALIRISIIVAVVVWVAEHPGTITIDWMSYKMTFHVGFFLLSLLLIVILGIVLFSLIKAALDLPHALGHRRELVHKDKGIKALTIGLSAVAAGDAKVASYQAQRARQFLDKDHALPKLLEAQAARLDGREGDAAQAFVALMADKDAGFLGVRGLLQAALDREDYAGALDLGHRALEQHPKQAWILHIVYDLEIRARRWGAARKVLDRAEKVGVVPVNKANSDRVAMFLAEAAEEAKAGGAEKAVYRLLGKAFKLDRHFVPTVLWLGRVELVRGKRRAVVSMVEEAWKFCPHPGLVALWNEAYVPPKGNDSLARVQWFEKLLSFKPESVEGLQALAQVLTQEGLWGDARQYLEKAEEIRPNVTLYKLWAELERGSTQDEDAVRAWLEKAADAPRERVWICSETGRIYDHWMPISDQGLFNTIIWDFPQGRGVHSALLENAERSLSFLEAPKV